MKKTSETAAAPKGRILLVEDERQILESYSHLLVDAGFEVAGVTKPVEALRRAAAEPFDLIVTDYSLPGMNGLELLRRLRAQSLNLPIVMMLEVPDNRIAIEVTEAGAVQSLVKPIEPRELREIAAYGVQRHRAQRRPSSFRQGAKRAEALSVSATEAKNKFGSVLERVIRGDVMFITKHDGPKAVLLPVEEYYALSHAPEAKLDTLTAEFDAMLARMQTQKARAAVRRAFHASPKELGRAAVAAARKRG